MRLPCCAKQSLPIVFDTKKSFTPDLLTFNSEILQKHLIVDDSSYNRLVLKRFINFIGFPTDEVASAQEAIQMVVKNGVYDVIWLDYQLSSIVDTDNPVPNGVDLLKRLRKQYGYQGKIVVVTGYSNLRDQCLRNGANDFLIKPVDRSEIYRICNKTSTKTEPGSL